MARPAPTAVARAVDRLDLLPALRGWGRWRWLYRLLHGSAGGVEIASTAPDGTDVARLALPDSVATMRQPHVRLTLQTRAGRLGVGLRPCPFGPPEQHVDPSRHPVTFDLELPEMSPPEVILRKTSEGPLDAVVSELMLRDRPR